MILLPILESILDDSKNHFWAAFLVIFIDSCARNLKMQTVEAFDLMRDFDGRKYYFKVYAPSPSIAQDYVSRCEYKLIILCVI